MEEFRGQVLSARGHVGEHKRSRGGGTDGRTVHGPLNQVGCRVESKPVDQNLCGNLDRRAVGVECIILYGAEERNRSPWGLRRIDTSSPPVNFCCHKPSMIVTS